MWTVNVLLDADVDVNKKKYILTFSWSAELRARG